MDGLDDWPTFLAEKIIEIQWMLYKTAWENMDVIGKSSYLSFQFHPI